MWVPCLKSLDSPGALKLPALEALGSVGPAPDGSSSGSNSSSSSELGSLGATLEPLRPLPPADPLVPHGTGPTTFQDVWYSVKDGAAYLHWAHVDGVSSTAQCKRLETVLRAACSHPEVRVVVLAGGPSYFGNGINYNTVHASGAPAAEAWANISALTDVVQRVLASTDRVTIAALQGDASAGGAMLAMACDYVWTHGDVLLNPHYGDSSLFGSEYWTYTLPRRVGSVAAARDVTASLQPMSANTGVELGLVNAVLTPGRVGFMAAVEQCVGDLLRDAPTLATAIADKQARLGAPTALKDMHRARVYEGVIARDNVKDARHVGARAAFVHKELPMSSPLHLAGQAGVSGRVLDGKALAAKKVASVRKAVAALKAVRGSGCDGGMT